MAVNKPIIKLESITLSNIDIYKSLVEKSVKDLNFTYFQKRDPLKAIKNHCRTIILLVDKQIAGYYHLDQNAQKTWFGIFIVEEYRGKGFGKLLLKDAQEFSIINKIDLHLMVYTNNINAFKMYQEMKFNIISTIDDKIFMRWNSVNKK